MGRHERNGRTDLRKAALKRKADAWSLWRADGEHGRGAAYIGGYAIECKLKAIAMEIFNCWTLDQLAAKWGVKDEREVYTHGLEVFASRLPLYQRLRTSPVWRDFAGQVNRWRVDWRYDPHDWEKKRTQAFLEAVDRVYGWLESNRC